MHELDSTTQEAKEQMIERDNHTHQGTEKACLQSIIYFFGEGENKGFPLASQGADNPYKSINQLINQLIN